MQLICILPFGIANLDVVCPLSRGATYVYTYLQ